MSFCAVSKARRPFLVAHSFLVNQQRTNTRESIHRYVEPNKFKKHMLAASEPYFKRQYLLPEESCKGTKPPPIEMHPLQKIEVMELVDEIKQNEVVLVVQYNYTPFQSDRVYRNTIIKSGGTFHFLKNPVYKEAFRILNWSDFDSLFIGRNALITGKADCLSRCVNSLRKMPQYILLSGMIDGHMYSLDQLQLIAATPTLDAARANLLNTLTTPASELYSYLELHHNNIKPSYSVDSDSGENNKIDDV